VPYPKLMELIAQFRKRYLALVAHVAPTDAGFIGHRERRLLSILNKRKLERVLGYLLDENEFLGPHGIRSLSRYHLEHPCVLHVAGQEYKVQYLPAESDTGMFGGNSNWRGPVWMPLNMLLIESLLRFHSYYGDDFTVECPVGSGQMVTLAEAAAEVGGRLVRLFLRDEHGRRPYAYGHAEPSDTGLGPDLGDDAILFHEYFDGDTGRGLGASHQTGWTGLVATLIQSFADLDADAVLNDTHWPLARAYRPEPEAQADSGS
jgi:hypothetical protein